MITRRGFLKLLGVMAAGTVLPAPALIPEEKVVIPKEEAISQPILEKQTISEGWTKTNGSGWTGTYTHYPALTNGFGYPVTPELDSANLTCHTTTSIVEGIGNFASSQKPATFILRGNDKHYFKITGIVESYSVDSQIVSDMNIINVQLIDAKMEAYA